MYLVVDCLYFLFTNKLMNKSFISWKNKFRLYLISFRILRVIIRHSSSSANFSTFESSQKWVTIPCDFTYTKKKQEAKKILEMASSTVKKDKKLILTKTIIVNIVLSDGKNKKESTTINCKCIGAKMESKPSK